MLDVGVVIARFQVPRLTLGHRAVLNAAALHAKLVVLIGTCTQATEKNPLDYLSRLEMVRQEYPTAIIVSLPDVEGDDKMWSESVDNTLKYLLGGETDITFYGGRDSFFKSYSGKHHNFHTVHQVSKEAWSGTTDRDHVLAGFNPPTEDFRRGVIYGVTLARNT